MKQALLKVLLPNGAVFGIVMLTNLEMILKLTLSLASIAYTVLQCAAVRRKVRASVLRQNSCLRRSEGEADGRESKRNDGMGRIRSGCLWNRVPAYVLVWSRASSAPQSANLCRIRRFDMFDRDCHWPGSHLRLAA